MHSIHYFCHFLWLFQDPETGVNKDGINEWLSGLGGGGGLGAAVGSLAYSSATFPSTSVMINWHQQGQYLTYIKEQWLVDAAVRLNPKLRHNGSNLNFEVPQILHVQCAYHILSCCALK